MTSAAPLRLGLIIGSSREGRFGEIVARWFETELTHYPQFEVSVIDVIDWDFGARHRTSPTETMERFRGQIRELDAFVVVAAEYNHGYTAALKNAIDMANQQWHAKPVGFIAYGGVAGGLRAVEQLRQVFAELHVVTMRDAVSFHHIPGTWKDGHPADPARASISVERMLHQLEWWGQVLRTGRVSTPYGQ